MSEPSGTNLSQVIELAPLASVEPGETHAALLLSQQSWSGDLVFSGAVSTDAQLRLNSPPNPWETAWIVWDYTDNEHFYYFALKTNGWELGKRDPAYPGGQRFLATGSETTFPVGAWNAFSIVQSGGTISVSVNGVELVSFVDLERPYAGGRVGVYTEDARIFFDNAGGVVTDDFESYAAQPLADGAALGSQWLTAFLGYGYGGVTSLAEAAVTPAVVAALPLSATWSKVLTGGSKGDRLQGGSGAELLDGRGGADTLTGGAGDDTYVVDSAKDRVVESQGGGVDTVRSTAASYVLPNFVENLTLVGGGGQKGVGNALSNVLVANGGRATLDGGAGNDILISGGGQEVLTGGLGRDLFQFQKAPLAPALITDFTRGQDVLDLRPLLAGYTGAEPLRDDWVRWSSDGASGVRIWVDPDGPSGSAGFLAVADLQGVSLPLAAQTDWVFR